MVTEKKEVWGEGCNTYCVDMSKKKENATSGLGGEKEIVRDNAKKSSQQPKKSVSRDAALGSRLCTLVTLIVPISFIIQYFYFLHPHLLERLYRGEGPVEVYALNNLKCDTASYTDDAHECSKIMNCGRWVFDKMFKPEVMDSMEDMVEQILSRAQGGGTGGPSVVDLHTRVVSYKDTFIDLDVVLKHYQWNITETHKEHYKYIRNTIRNKIVELSKLPEERMHLDKGFFSYINGSQSANTVHDEYWHEHIDTEQYGTFTYTSLLYFGEKGSSFQGGDLVFKDGHTIKPERARLVIFSSGQENPHWATKFSSGIRILLVSALTCNEKVRVDLDAL